MLSERIFDGMRDVYDVSLKAALRHRRLVMALFLAIVVATGFLFYHMPKGFLPSEDTGQLFAFTEAAQDISFDAMSKLQQQAAAIVRADPNVDSVMAFIGATGASQSLNLGRIFIRLKPRDERVSADEIIQRTAPQAGGDPGHEGVPAEPADDPHRRPADQERSTSSRCRTRTPRSCSTGRRSSRTSCAACRASSTSPATCRSPIRR